MLSGSEADAVEAMRQGGKAMLLQRYGKQVSGKTLLTLGQATLLVGLGFIAAGQVLVRFRSDAPGFSWVDFLCGFCHGFGGMTMGVSIVLNVVGLRRSKAERAEAHSSLDGGHAEK